MSNNTIITIGRQYGSGGKAIGEQLSKELGIPFYDKELIALAAEKKKGHHGHEKTDLLKEVDERASNSLLYSLSTGMVNLHTGTGPTLYNLPMNDRLFIVQADLIKQFAKEGPCVIVGRCADYILRENPDLVRVFIHAELEKRIQRATTEYGISPEKAEDTVHKIDKKRASYYNYYSSRKWGHLENYDLCINSGLIGIDGAVKLIRQFVELKEGLGR